ncbi:MAG: hypothetical protein RRY76_05360, partial [Clostridia bacterium]
MKQEIGLAEKFKRLVKMQREFLDISTPEIAAASRVSVWTHCAHLRNPGKITLTEMQYLCKKLG